MSDVVNSRILLNYNEREERNILYLPSYLMALWLLISGPRKRLCDNENLWGAKASSSIRSASGSLWIISTELKLPLAHSIQIPTRLRFCRSCEWDERIKWWRKLELDEHQLIQTVSSFFSSSSNFCRSSYRWLFLSGLMRLEIETLNLIRILFRFLYNSRWR